MERVSEISHLKGGTGLKLAGELDLYSAQELTAALAGFQDAEEVWIDVTEVTFIDSSALRSILTFATSRNGKGKVVIVDPTAVVGPVFKILGLDEYTGVEVLARHPKQVPSSRRS